MPSRHGSYHGAQRDLRSTDSNAAVAQRKVEHNSPLSNSNGHRFRRLAILHSSKPTEAIQLKRNGTVERFTLDHPLVQSGDYMKRSVSQHSFEHHGQEDDGFQRFHDAMLHHTVDPVKEEAEGEDEVRPNDKRRSSGRKIKSEFGANHPIHRIHEFHWPTEKM